MKHIALLFSIGLLSYTVVEAGKKESPRKGHYKTSSSDLRIVVSGLPEEEAQAKIAADRQQEIDRLASLAATREARKKKK
jgi:hypothetical protein